MTDERGHRHIVLAGKHFDFLPNPTFDPIAVAGCLLEVFKGEKSMIETKNTAYSFEPLADRPEYQQREARVAPDGRAGGGGRPPVPDPRVWPRGGHRRRRRPDHGPAVVVQPMAGRGVGLRLSRTGSSPPRCISLSRPGRGRPDARVGARAGVPGRSWSGPRRCRRARACARRPIPCSTRSGPAARKSGVLVCGHLSATGYHRYSGDWTGVYEFAPHRPQGPFASIATHARATMDFFTAMVVQGAVTRHPRLRLLSVENGSDWVHWIVERFKVEYQRYPGAFPEEPVAAFERCVWVVPYWEEPIHELTTYVPVERILAGSDFPHSDGLPEPPGLRQGAGPVLRRRRPAHHARQPAIAARPPVVALPADARPFDAGAHRPGERPPGPDADRSPARVRRARPPCRSGSGRWPPPTATETQWSGGGGRLTYRALDARARRCWPGACWPGASARARGSGCGWGTGPSGWSRWPPWPGAAAVGRAPQHLLLGRPSWPWWCATPTCRGSSSTPVPGRRPAGPPGPGPARSSPPSGRRRGPSAAPFLRGRVTTSRW